MKAICDCYFPLCFFILFVFSRFGQRRRLGLGFYSCLGFFSGGSSIFYSSFLPINEFLYLHPWVEVFYPVASISSIVKLPINNLVLDFISSAAVPVLL